MATVVQEIMQQHAKGIDFRERNAGVQIDDKMQDEVSNLSGRISTRKINNFLSFFEWIADLFGSELFINREDNSFGYL